VKASDLFVRCLEQEGVELVFGIPGEETIDLIDSLSRSPIRFVLVRHEQAAAFMADVYGRLTGKPGVCLATLGPGATNLVTGVANAHVDRSPLIAITGQAERSRLHKESHQNIDTVGLFRCITKYDEQIKVARTIPEVVRKAFRQATLESPGAVHIQLPEDVAAEDVDGAPLPVIPEPETFPDERQLDGAMQWIERAERPIVLAGNGVIRGRAWQALRAWIEKANLPMVNTFMAKGILPKNHPLNLFTVGTKPAHPDLRPLYSADLVIAVGYDLVEYDPVVWNPDGSRHIVYIHTVPAEVDEHFPVVCELIGNIAKSLEALAAKVKRRPDSEIHRNIRARILEDEESHRDLPHAVMRVLTERLPENAVVVSDVGLHKVWLAKSYHPKQPNRTIIFNGFASMGGAVPGAIAAKLVHPQDPVVAVSGDGGFLMNGVELETARRLGLPFTVVVFNDRRYSLIAKKQRDAHLPVTDISFTNPDFEWFAKSFGARYAYAENRTQFEQALQQSLPSTVPAIVEVQLPEPGRD
jgi:acetolactate synthase-1/2/3 large subunit